MYLALSAGCHPPPSNAKQVRVASATLEPLAYLDADGKPAGFYVDVMREAARREGLTLEYSLHQKGLESALTSGSVDLWAAAVANPNRRRLIYFAEPWWANDYYLLTTAGSTIRNADDLAGKRVTYMDAPPLALSIDQAFPGVTGLPMPSTVGQAAAVCRGEADAALMALSSLYMHFLKRTPECDGVAWRLVSQQRLRSELSIAAPFANRDLADRMQARVREMAQDGSLARFAEKYPMVSMHSSNLIRASVEEKDQQAALQRALMAALAFSLLSMYWALRMRRERERSNVLRREAERALAVKSEFLATMSHEIRTPLTAVVGYLDMLGDTSLSPDQKLLAREGRGATAALLAMVSEILDFSRMRAAPAELHPAPCDPGMLLDDVVSAVSPQAEAKGLRIEVQVEPEVPAVMVTDSTRLLQVMMNLAGNAVKFTERGSVRLSMRYVENADGRGCLVLKVADSGPGIPPAEQKRIFEPFTQLDSSDRRRHGGVGLGLAIVQRLVSALKGDLQLHSVVGEGTEFIVQIPVERTADRRTWLQTLAAEAGQPLPRLLLVGPMEGSLDFLRQTWDRLRVPVAVCADEAACREELGRLEPGLPVCALVDAGAAAGLREVMPSVAPGISIRWVLMGSHGQLKASDAATLAAFQLYSTWPVTVGFLRLLVAAPSAPVVAPGTEAASHKPVLVVDDNPVNRMVLGKLLEKLGYQADFATDGEEAVRKCLEGTYQLILMDCQMPVLDGFAATERIRGETSRPRVAVVGVSASMEEATRLHCLESGMDDYLSKPVDLARLRDVIARLRT